MKTHTLIAALFAVFAFVAQAANFRWARTNASGNSGLWNDPGMWTVSGDDDDGIPDADDRVKIGPQDSGSGVTKPVFNGAVYSCYGLEMCLRTEGYVALTLSFSNGGLRIGAGGVNFYDGNEWQDWSRFESNFSIELTADQTWSHNGSNFHVHGPVSGAYQLTFSGSDRDLRLNNAGNTFSGGFVQKSGRTVFTKGETVENGEIVSGPLGTGKITLAGGTLAARDVGSSVSLYNPVEFSGNKVKLGDSGCKIVFAPGVSDTFVLSAAANGATRELDAATDVDIDRTIVENGATGIAFAKSGSKKVTLGGSSPNAYTGGTVVNNGSVSSAKEGAFGKGDVTITRLDMSSTSKLVIPSGTVSAIADTAALRLNGYHGDNEDNLAQVSLGEGVVEKVKALYIDGVAQEQGRTYGGADSPADVKLVGWFEGAGVVRVVSLGTIVVVR